MKEVALYDAKNTLSALIQDVEESGCEIVITRHGKPAAKLVPVDETTRERQQRAWGRLAELREEAAKSIPNAPPMSWEELKRLMRDEGDGIG